ncbi:hypothetical protein BC936DRAFT_138246 [Jimgerdemannia flammicorona]|uniref:Uncharacterized protein n=2 Tax=Jimgerdemannia flammicorona TaxID=994334 RepID=A0A433Q291_9FUNG|nr:hypothetical protein BC936DRAFT_138246 [Jimgerdemannia flammicorona]RUS23794.1 hypothetical protein BC938DRAFT_474619 [Jimgerdemannia flammicorona]
MDFLAEITQSFEEQQRKKQQLLEAERKQKEAEAEANRRREREKAEAEAARRRAHEEAARRHRDDPPRSDRRRNTDRDRSRSASPRRRPARSDSSPRSLSRSPSPSPSSIQNRDKKDVRRKPPQGERGGKPWTLDEDALVRDLHASKLYSMDAIAEKLNRSKSSVLNRINRLMNPDYKHDDEDELDADGRKVIPPTGDYTYVDMAVVALYHLLPDKTGTLNQIAKIVERFFGKEVDQRRLDGCVDVPRFRAAMSGALGRATTSDRSKRDERLERLQEKIGNEYKIRLTPQGVKCMETYPRFARFLKGGGRYVEVHEARSRPHDISDSGSASE